MIDTQHFIHYQAPLDALNKRIIVVTGAGDGIGKAVAKGLASHGATVILLGRTLSKLEQVYDQIEQAGHPQPAIFPINFDGAVTQDYEQLKTALEDEFGHIDGLLHNAGVLANLTPVEQHSVSEWQRSLQVNVTAPFMLTRALMPLLRKSEDARIVFTSSSVGNKGRAFWGSYAVAKAAVLNLMEVLADELEATPIRVNAINPGPVRTNMRAKAYPAEDPNNLITAEQIVNRYVFLMGPEGKAMHGLNLDAQPS